MKPLALLPLAFLVILACAPAARSQDLTPDLRAKVESAIQVVLRSTSIPSASVGIARSGRVIFAIAYGSARLDPHVAATPQMAYPVGSISKQFTATCILLLQQDGKLTLDDPVSRWFPDLTQASEITLRNLLSHTSGYEDYAPQDYTIPAWTVPTDPLAIVNTWAKKPLDFAPGTKWQYSNTNFVLAALIVEKASGMKFIDFLRTRVLKPAGLVAVLDLDTQRDRVLVQGYERRALAPVRPATLEAPGWYFGDGSLAMPVADLLHWDNDITARTLLTPASYDALETPVTLKDGTPTHYALGIQVGHLNGHRIFEHSGEVGGFVAENMIFPDESDNKLAIAVLTNQEATEAASQIARALVPLLLPPAPRAAATATLTPADQAKTILTGLLARKIDRTLFTPNANFYFSDQTLDDFASSLSPLGTVTAVTQGHDSLRGGMTERSFTATFSSGTRITLSTYTTADGKLEQFLVTGKL